MFSVTVGCLQFGFDDALIAAEDLELLFVKIFVQGRSPKKPRFVAKIDSFP